MQACRISYFQVLNLPCIFSFLNQFLELTIQVNSPVVMSITSLPGGERDKMHRPLTLMDLPAEMRLAIYAFALPEFVMISAFLRLKDWEESIDDPALFLKSNEYQIETPDCELPKFLLASKQIHVEAWPLFVQRLILNKVYPSGKDRDHYTALIKQRSVIQLPDITEIEHVIVERNEIVKETVNTPTRYAWWSEPERQSLPFEPPFPRLKSITITRHFVDTPTQFQSYWFHTMGQDQPCVPLNIMKRILRKAVVGLGPPDYLGRTDELAKQYAVSFKLPEYHAHLQASSGTKGVERMAVMTGEVNWNTDILRIKILADKELKTCSEGCVSQKKITNWYTLYKDKWLELSEHYPEYQWGVCFENLLLDIVIFRELGDKDVVYLEA